MTDKNPQFSFKNWRFLTFNTFSLRLWSSVDADFCISSAYVTSGTKRSFCFWNIPASGGLNRKNLGKKREILAFKPLLPEIRLKNLTSRIRFSEALTSKLWNKKKYTAKAYRNGAKLNCIQFSTLRILDTFQSFKLF